MHEDGAGVAPEGDPAGTVPWRRALVDPWALAGVAAFLYWTTIEALRPMVALQLDGIGASTTQVGTAVAAYAVVGLFLSVPGGAVVDRIGSRRLLVAGFASLGACGVLYAMLADSVAGLALMQLVTGAGALAVWVALQAAVTHAGSGDGLRKQLAIFSTGWAGGSAVGPVLGGWLFGSHGFVAVATMLVLAGVGGVLASWWLPVPAESGGGTRVGTLRRSAGELLAIPTIRLVLAASFVSLAVQSLRTSFYPLYLADRGLSPSAIGGVLTLIGVSSLLVRLALPALARAVGPRAVLVHSTWLAVAWVALAPTLTSLVPMLVGAVALGTSLGLNPPTTVEMMADATSARLRGTAMGLRVAANRAAMIVEPLFFGAIAAAMGAVAAYLLSGAVLAVAFGAVTVRARPGSRV